MKGNLFFDTNVICYAFDSSEPAKRSTCKKMIEKVYNGEISGVTSNQVLTETHNVLTRKFKMHASDVNDIMKSLATSKHWQRIDYSSSTVRQTIKDLSLFQIPFLDLLIAETMKENFISEIVTEDGKSFEKVPGIKVVNPFKA